MKSTVFLALSLMMMAIGGCAVPNKSTMVYTEAAFPSKLENEAVVNASFDDCWSKLISGLSSEFFVINNVEKASGLITLDFSTDAAEDFVDCGTTTRTYGDKTFTYAAAGDAEFQFDQKVSVNVARQTVQRTTSLSGKINVHVSEVPGGTKVAVNVRYIWTNVVGGYYRLAGSLMSGPVQALDRQTVTKTFNTNAPSARSDSEDISCGSNGKLEKRILDIVNSGT